MPFAALVLAAQLAFVPDAAPVPPQAPAYYGHQILLADVALVAAAFGTEEPGFLLGLVATGPLIHAFHGRTNGAIVMSGLRRAGLPVGGLILGAAACDDHGSDDEEWGESAFGCLGPAFGGFLIGAAVAEVWDLAVATEDPPMPMVLYDGQHAMVGLGGRF